jgi:hypothetical protein
MSQTQRYLIHDWGNAQELQNYNIMTGPKRRDFAVSINGPERPWKCTIRAEIQLL